MPPVPHATIHVLLVEDDPAFAGFAERVLKLGQKQIEVAVCHRLSEAIELCQAEPSDAKPDAVLLDLGLPDSVGIEGVQALHAAAPGVPIIVLTGREEGELGEQTIAAGAADYVSKNEVEPRLIDKTVRFAIERQRRADAEMRERQQARAADTLFMSLRAAIDRYDSTIQETRSVQPAAKPIA